MLPLEDWIVSAPFFVTHRVSLIPFNLTTPFADSGVGITGRMVSGNLEFALLANGENSQAIAARQKIIRFHLHGNFDLDCFIHMDIKLLPSVLGWIGNDYYNQNDKGVRRSGMAAFYQFLRNFPGLCGYPSTYQIQMQLLEAEIAALKAENAVLRDQNEHLVLENERLRSAKQENLKRLTLVFANPF